jgi:hypothetical protein
MSMPVDTRIDQSPYQEMDSEGPMNQRVTIVPVPRIIEMYNVSERELEQIGQASTAFAMHLVFFGITFGASMAFLMSLLTAELTNRQLALVWALFVLVLATVYFGVQVYRSYHDGRKGVRAIKNESKKTQAGVSARAAAGASQAGPGR